MQLRTEQRVVVDKAKEILSSKGLMCLFAEVRTGKSIMSLTIANEGTSRKYNNVCFITKKKAISSVESDYQKSGFKFQKLTVTNFEQADKLLPEYDLIIVDESHGLGSYPKPSKRTKDIKAIVGSAHIILMSGTPTPESYSQIYHQMFISKNSPFAVYVNFYKWAKEYVTVGKRYFGAIEFNDYSKAKEDKIKEVIAPYMVNFSQEDAGFSSFVEEEILTVKMNENIYKLMDVLKKKKVYKMKSDEAIIADTPVKLQSIFHQLSSGTIKIEEKRYDMDESKVKFIAERFKDKKIAIFYKFIAEGDLLRRWFPNATDSPEEFNESTDKVFICQIITGREGINLSTAEALVMYNIDFSATSYWQVRARIQTKDRVSACKLYWIFSDNGIERHIYKAVNNKKNFTLSYFNQSLKQWNPNSNLR